MIQVGRAGFGPLRGIDRIPSTTGAVGEGVPTAAQQRPGHAGPRWPGDTKQLTDHTVPAGIPAPGPPRQNLRAQDPG